MISVRDFPFNGGHDFLPIFFLLRIRQYSDNVPPLAGLIPLPLFTPGLTPGAIHWRAFGAERPGRRAGIHRTANVTIFSDYQ